MRVIGLTGSIACGKSTVSGEILRRGYPVIDGDQLSRELTSSGGKAIPAIRNAFGGRYIAPDGSMNRRAMANLVFSSDDARNSLDEVMAPYLKELTLKRLEQLRESGARICFLDFPLLFEKGYDALCDTVWCVWLPENLQVSRLTERDGISREDAMKRIRCVLSSDEKANRSTAVIDNSGTVEETMDQLSELLEREEQRIREPSRRRRAARQPDSDPPLPEPPLASAEPPLPPADPLRPAAVGTVERSASSRRKPSGRKVSWQMPKPLTAVLVILAAVLAVTFTANILMNAYLVRQEEKHAAEQKSIDEHYPLDFREPIRRIAGEYNLSPALVAAVILNESSFRPRAESSVGARGLMQVMPETGKWIAGQLRTDGYTDESLYDPETNIRFGCWYLNYLSSLFAGNPLCVVCAYHAGQGEISSWLANPLYSSDGITLMEDRLPEGPTKQYAGRVTRDYGIYQAKYFTAAQPSGGADAPASP